MRISSALVLLVSLVFGSLCSGAGAQGDPSPEPQVDPAIATCFGEFEDEAARIGNNTVTCQDILTVHNAIKSPACADYRAEYYQAFETVCGRISDLNKSMQCNVKITDCSPDALNGDGSGGETPVVVKTADAGIRSAAVATGSTLFVAVVAIVCTM